MLIEIDALKSDSFREFAWMNVEWPRSCWLGFLALGRYGLGTRARRAEVPANRLNSDAPAETSRLIKSLFVGSVPRENSSKALRPSLS